MLKKTSLYEIHKKLNAKFVEFNGWKMPIFYTSVIDEHNSIRTNMGMFDISHMSVFKVLGENAAKFLNYITVGNIVNLHNNQARYSMILNELGGIKDDIIVYKLYSNEYMIVVNAGNSYKILQWLNTKKLDKVTIEDISNEISIIALQGPKSSENLNNILNLNSNILSMKYYSILDLEIKSIEPKFCKIARTGYTGEDGFEIFISNEFAAILWNKLILHNIKPCGLGCRDTLRLECCMPLYGHEIDENITPIDTGFCNLINWDVNFIGKDILLKQKDKQKKQLIAFKCISGIARNKDKIFLDNKKIGYVTSGTFSPTLKLPIGMALINSEKETTLHKNNTLKAEIHKLKKDIFIIDKPFYKRK